MKYCNEQGCRTLIATGRYCIDHKRKYKKKPWQSNNKSFYRSQAWIDLKGFVYQRDRGMCQRCRKFVFGKDAHSHHIVPIRVNPKLKLVADNITLLCSKCHMVVEDETNEAHGLKTSQSFSWKT